MTEPRIDGLTEAGRQRRAIAARLDEALGETRALRRWSAMRRRERALLRASGLPFGDASLLHTAHDVITQHESWVQVLRGLEVD